MRNFVYVLSDDDGVAMLVDPAFEKEAVLQRVRDLGVRVTHVLATHGHPDHVLATGFMREKLGARVVAHASADHAPVDVRVEDGATFRVGAVEVRVVHTPGHRFDSVCYQVDGTHLLTGDTIFVGECGRVDLPGSDPVAMHRSLTTLLRSLPDGLVVLPGHDYGRTPTSTLGREKRENPTMEPRTLDEFLRFMAEP
jgi:glyoxylase-like metal-dependent hydrolase (beta-lactamase superfamily II)